jgi:3-oxoacyl-[acyl-carrier protein] reductase
MNRLQGKVALVTGAARGLGLAIAKRFVEEGASVVLNDLEADAAEKAAAPLGGIAVAADVSDSAAVARMFAAVSARCGRLDVLVNNAGVSGVEGDPERAARFRRLQLQQAQELAAGGPVRTHLDQTIEVTDEEWHRMLAVHLDGTFFCSRAALSIMNPMHRLGDPDDIAWAAVYLASEEAKFMTGQVLSPNGGWHMSQ